MSQTSPSPQNVATLLVDSLAQAGVQYVFGIPGAKIDGVFNALLDHPTIKLIVCRHEQNAGFMAAAVGRLTGTPGVCIATSGPGASNLCTALATATTEGDPVVALIGEVPRAMSTKHTHQSMRALDMLAPIAKKTIAIHVEDQAAEVLLEGFRAANTYPKGAVVLSVPQDVAGLSSKILPFPPKAFHTPRLGPAAGVSLTAAKQALEGAKLPVLLLGMRASAPSVVYAIRAFLAKHPVPVVETFQAAGAVPRELVHLFYGRIGLFRNQPGDKLLARSDCVVAVGYDPTEYDAGNWNPSGRLEVIHVDYTTCAYDFNYQPVLELLGSVRENFEWIAENVEGVRVDESREVFTQELMREFNAWRSTECEFKPGEKVQPLHFVRKLQELLPGPGGAAGGAEGAGGAGGVGGSSESEGGSGVEGKKGGKEETTVVTDVGTVYIYMMRHFYAYQPRSFLSSNGQQTLGVGLPWAIAANLVQDPPCSRRVVSVSGDGGFMVSLASPFISSAFPLPYLSIFALLSQS